MFQNVGLQYGTLDAGVGKLEVFVAPMKPLAHLSIKPLLEHASVGVILQKPVHTCVLCARTLHKHI